MQQIWQQLYLFHCGISDSLKLRSIVHFCFQKHDSSKKIRKTIYQSQIQIVCIYIASIYLFDYISNFEFFQILSHYNLFVNIMFQIAYYVYFCILWLFSQIYVLFWFGDIASEAITLERDVFKNPKFQQKSQLDFETLGAIAMKKYIFLIVYAFFSIFTGIFLQNLPYLKVIWWIIISLYDGVFLFFFKWMYNSYLLAFFDKNLSYFLGFGLIFSLIYNQFQGAMNFGVFWLLSPIFILISINSQPPDVEKIKSFSDMMKLIISGERKDDAYEIHNKRLREDQQYKKNCDLQPGFFKITKLVTHFINDKILENMLKNQ